VVVLWSTSSVRSQYVRDEAQEGLDLGKLVPVLIEAVKPPMGFRQLQAANLANWDGEHSDSFEDLLDAVSAASDARGSVKPVGRAPESQPAVAPRPNKRHGLTANREDRLEAVEGKPPLGGPFLRRGPGSPFVALSVGVLIVAATLAWSLTSFRSPGPSPAPLVSTKTPSVVEPRNPPATSPPVPSSNNKLSAPSVSPSGSAAPPPRFSSASPAGLPGENKVTGSNVPAGPSPTTDLPPSDENLHVFCTLSQSNESLVLFYLQVRKFAIIYKAVEQADPSRMSIVALRLAGHPRLAQSTMDELKTMGCLPPVPSGDTTTSSQPIAFFCTMDKNEAPRVLRYLMNHEFTIGTAFVSETNPAEVIIDTNRSGRPAQSTMDQLERMGCRPRRMQPRA